MRFAVFRCCPSHLLQAYEVSANAILKALDLTSVEVKEFNCCGYPFKNIDFKSYLLSSSRNLAVAEQRDLDIITLCDCCYGSLQQAKHVLDQGSELKEEVNRSLRRERLEYGGKARVRHLLDVLYRDVGIESLKSKVVRPYQGLKVAAHYGCHLLRPSQTACFDNPMNPAILDRLIEVTGAKCVEWSKKTKCCGAPLIGIDDELSENLAAGKMRDAADAGADLLCSTCLYCQLRFSQMQASKSVSGSCKPGISSVLYPQLLGLSLGIEPFELRINPFSHGISSSHDA
ncbi:MAG: disulfide reductase [Desulfobacteraceae bacterium]|nr:MAG: disulfide reductase [Desulfobacteraceae bacterium]